MTIHPIEQESYRILAERVDLSSWVGVERDVVARMIHATADLSFGDSTRIGAHAIVRALDALEASAPVIVDASMVAAGITTRMTTCFLGEVPIAPAGTTRSAAAIALAASRHPAGAVWVIGNAPTALVELLALCGAGNVDPAAIIGLPVGFVGAAESKAALWASDLADRSITNLGERGGSAVAASALNALLRHVKGIR